MTAERAASLEVYAAQTPGADPGRAMAPPVSADRCALRLRDAGGGTDRAAGLPACSGPARGLHVCLPLLLASYEDRSSLRAPLDAKAKIGVGERGQCGCEGAGEVL